MTERPRISPPAGTKGAPPFVTGVIGGVPLIGLPGNPGSEPS